MQKSVKTVLIVFLSFMLISCSHGLNTKSSIVEAPTPTITLTLSVAYEVDNFHANMNEDGFTVNLLLNEMDENSIAISANCDKNVPHPNTLILWDKNEKKYRLYFIFNTTSTPLRIFNVVLNYKDATGEKEKNFLINTLFNSFE